MKALKFGRFLPFLLIGAVAPAGAQTVTLDEGGFRLLIKGQEVGTETFTVRQNGSGESAVVMAQSRVVMDTARGGQQVRASLQTSGTGLRPASYDVQVEGANAERIAGRVVGGRFSARIISSSGEEMREYLASEGAVVADEGVASHYYFLAQRVGNQGGRVPVIIPRRGQQVMATVTSRGKENVTIAGASVSAHKLLVGSAGSPDRHLWIDDRGRVLRLEIPERDFVAERIAAPR